MSLTYHFYLGKILTNLIPFYLTLFIQPFDLGKNELRPLTCLKRQQASYLSKILLPGIGNDNAFIFFPWT